VPRPDKSFDNYIYIILNTYYQRLELKIQNHFKLGRFSQIVIRSSVTPFKDKEGGIF
jgi:hypothetical protein